MTIESAAEPAPPLQAKVEFLKQAASYPDKPGRIEARETHTSWVFLGDTYVYKLKKPLRYAFLDFSTVAARRRNCEAEVRLNRRLSKEVYLGIVPLRVDRQGMLHLNGADRIIDWLVKMWRLPDSRMLGYRIRQGTVEDQDIVKVAQRLADFYQHTAPVAMDAAAYRQRFIEDIKASAAELSTPEFGLSAARIRRITNVQLAFLQDRAALFTERLAERRIIEAHGDLRPEHIYLGEHPIIIDCLEFNREFRLLDPADELAFLAVECERLGAAFVASILFKTYREMTRDACPAKLIHFYESYRALLWATLAIRHLQRCHAREHAKWLGRTNAYLALAEAHNQQAQALEGPNRDCR